MMNSSTTDKYERVVKPRDEGGAENEVRVTSNGGVGSYVSYCMGLLKQENVSCILVKGMGRAISKAVTVAEVVKRKHLGLYQNTEIGSSDIVDEWTPLEEGLKVVKTTRRVSFIVITLSKTELDKSLVGYQAPITQTEIEETIPDNTGESAASGSDEKRGGRNRRGRGRRGRGRGRGRGKGKERESSNVEETAPESPSESAVVASNE